MAWQARPRAGRAGHAGLERRVELPRALAAARALGRREPARRLSLLEVSGQEAGRPTDGRTGDRRRARDRSIERDDVWSVAVPSIIMYTHICIYRSVLSLFSLCSLSVLSREVVVGMSTIERRCVCWSARDDAICRDV